MKRAWVVVLVLLGLSSSAYADRETAWKVTLGTSIGLTLGGGYMYWHGWDTIQDVRAYQCDHGAGLPGDTSCFNNGPRLTPEELQRSNAEGDRAAGLMNVGALTTAAGAVLVGVSLYKVLTIKRERDQSVVVVPTVSTQGAGASLTLSW